LKIKWAVFLLVLIAAPLAAQEKSRVVEEIVARVNNEIITRSDLEHSRASLTDEVRQDCPRCTREQLQVMVAQREKNLLRDLIDQSLLAQRGKDMGENVEPEVVKRLDEIRRQNKLESMEDLEKKLSEQGLGFEDFKNSIRNSLLTQDVIRREVGSRIILGHDEIEKYYSEHKNDFQRPEQVYLAEIFVSTEGKNPEEIPELEKKARGLLEKVNKGDDFAELARRRSDSSSAQRGGELGVFERGQLSKEIEDIVFKMKRGQVTDLIRTKTGFLILRLEQHYDAGLQPLEKVEGEISNRLYMQKMEPALRTYLQRLRQDSYVVVKPGYMDSAAVTSSPIQEVEPSTDNERSKKGKKGFLFFGKRKKSSS